MKKESRFSRRDFIKGAAAAFGAPQILRGAPVGANSRINVAMIGTGNQGSHDTRAFLAEPDVQVVAVCDVNHASHGYKTDTQFLGRQPVREMVEKYYGAQRRSGTYHGCDSYSDFRDVIARKDVDVVGIVTPDHWHAIIAIRAAAAGKDIYCEKPLSLTVEEGRAMADAVKRYGVVLQTGTHHRSSPRLRFVCELVRNGRIGQLKRMVAYVPGWNKMGPASDWRPMPVPEGFDYEMWLGPAPFEPYHKDRCLYNFRFILDYSGGQVTNTGAHSIDLAQWAHGSDRWGPVEVEDAGSEWPVDGLFNVATKVAFRARYEDGVILECAQTDEPLACRFEGTEGFVQTGYWTSGLLCDPPSLRTSIIRPEEIHLGTGTNHFRNFLDCVHSRREPLAPVEVGHRSATLCHIGNIAMRLKRKLGWDPAAERFTNDNFANRLLGRSYRAPWALHG